MNPDKTVTLETPEGQSRTFSEEEFKNTVQMDNERIGNGPAAAAKSEEGPGFMKKAGEALK